MKYEEVLKDWEYLWSIGAANDMTGGYVDQKDLYLLLKNPTKRQAKECLEDQIVYWLQVGPDVNANCEYHDSYRELAYLLETDEKVKIIAEKYL